MSSLLPFVRPPERQPEFSRLLALWNDKRGERAMPSRADFDALELRDWFGHLMVIDVVENGRDFRYRLYGTNIASALGADHTGRHVNTVPPERQIVRCSDYRRVCRAKQPCVGTRPCAVGRKLYRAQYLLLPLSTDGERVDKIIAAIYGGPIAARQIPL